MGWVVGTVTLGWGVLACLQLFLAEREKEREGDGRLGKKVEKREWQNMTALH